jgi:hypothetical protein
MITRRPQQQTKLIKAPHILMHAHRAAHLQVWDFRAATWRPVRYIRIAEHRVEVYAHREGTFQTMVLRFRFDQKISIRVTEQKKAK